MTSNLRRIRAFAAILAISTALIIEHSSHAAVPLLNPPNLLTPANGATTSATPQFTWSAVQGAAGYNIVIAKSATPNTPVINQNLKGTSYQVGAALSPGTYVWKVRTKNATGKFGSWSQRWSFMVPQISGVKFEDSFTNYNAGACLADGSALGQWSVIYNGYGCVKVETDGITADKQLHGQPQISTNLNETHATLVVGPYFSGDLTYEGSLQTEAQIRTNDPPNAWEVGWIVWHYTDDTHFYYFIPKPNGWELGKEDPAYPGNQRNLLPPSASPTFPIKNWYIWKVVQKSNTISVYIDGNLIATYTDTERPYTSGKIGLYNEDAHVNFDDIKVSQP